MSNTNNLDGEKVHLGPEEGWIEWGHDGGPGARSGFLSGEPNNDRLRVRFYTNAASDRIIGKVWFGPGAEGPPGHAHGGSLSALLDEVMGSACGLAGKMAMTASMTIDYRKSVPLGTIATFEGWVEKESGRKVFPRSTLVGPDGTLFAEGSGLFIAVGGRKFLEMAQKRGSL